MLRGLSADIQSRSPEQDAVGDGKHRRVCADTQGQRGNGDYNEAGVSGPGSQAVAYVLEKGHDGLDARSRSFVRKMCTLTESA